MVRAALQLQALAEVQHARSVASAELEAIKSSATKTAEEHATVVEIAKIQASDELLAKRELLSSIDGLEKKLTEAEERSAFQVAKGLEGEEAAAKLQQELSDMAGKANEMQEMLEMVTLHFQFVLTRK